MNRIRQLSAVFGGALLLSTAGLVTTATSAGAAGCKGYSCHGLDPITEGCNVDSTKGYYGSEATVLNEYSGNCNANWIRAGLTTQGYNDGMSLILVITTTDSRGNLESMCYPGPNATGALNEYCYNHNYRSTLPAYSDMVDGTNRTFATAYVYSAEGNLVASYEADQ